MDAGEPQRRYSTWDVVEKVGLFISIASGLFGIALLAKSSADAMFSLIVSEQPFETIREFYWSPDSTQIAFWQGTIFPFSGEGSSGGLYLMNADGSGRRQVFGGELGNSIAWSPDGQWLAFSTPFTSLSQSESGIILLDINNGASRRIFNLDQGLVCQLAWSLDGKRLAFVIDQSSDGGLGVIDSDGNNMRQIMHQEDFILDLVWVTDREIAFLVDKSGSEESYLVDVDTGEQKPFQIDDEFWKKRWSPDGRWRLADALAPDDGEIYIEDSYGYIRQLTFDKLDKGMAKWVGNRVAYRVFSGVFDYETQYIVDLQDLKVQRLYPPVELQDLTCPEKLRSNSNGEIRATLLNFGLETLDVQLEITWLSEESKGTSLLLDEVNFLHTFSPTKTMPIQLSPNEKAEVKWKISKMQNTKGGYGVLDFTAISGDDGVKWSNKQCEIWLADLPYQQPAFWLIWIGVLGGWVLARPWKHGTQRLLLAIGGLLIWGAVYTLNWI